jgi:hypothetical protein
MLGSKYGRPANRGGRASGALGRCLIRLKGGARAAASSASDDVLECERSTEYLAKSRRLLEVRPETLRSER